jgi:hypothetical protein
MHTSLLSVLNGKLKNAMLDLQRNYLTSSAQVDGWAAADSVSCMGW